MIGNEGLKIRQRLGKTYLSKYIDCGQVEPPFGRQLVADVLRRTETAMSQAHCFLVAELALQAQSQAQRLGHLMRRTED